MAVIPARGKVLLKRVETAPSIPGGRIVLTERTREDLTSQQMEVIAVGAPTVCENEDCERAHDGWLIAGKLIGHGAPNVEMRLHHCEAQVGDWVLVAHRSLLETDQSAVFICHQDDVLAILEP